jgi:Flp pilus assembly pilin Flp
MKTKGQTMTEYVLILVAVAMVGFATLRLVGCTAPLVMYVINTDIASTR